MVLKEPGCAALMDSSFKRLLDHGCHTYVLTVQTLNAIKRAANLKHLTHLSMYIVYSILGFPRFNDGELDVLLHGKNQDEREFRYLTQFRKRIGPTLVIGFILHAALIIKNLLYCFYTITSFSTLQQSYRGNRGSNIREVAFGCLKTNCSTLSEHNSLLEDLKLLPVFRLCHPSLQQYYMPFIDTNIVGLIILEVCAYLMFIICIAAPINLYRNPLSHEVGVFIFCPDTIRAYHGEVVRKYLIECLASTKCYCLYRKRNLSKTKLKPNNLKIKLSSSLYELVKNQYYSEDQIVSIEESHLPKLAQDYDLLDRDTKDYIDDCIPFIRTEYYRRIMTGQYWSFFMINYGSIVVLSFGLVWYLTYQSNWMIGRVYPLIDYHIQASNCAIWSLTDVEQTKSIKLGEYFIRWTWIAIAELSFFVISVGMLLSILVGLSILVLQELIIEIGAQRDRLQLIIELTVLICESGAADQSTRGLPFSEPNSKSGDPKYDNQCDFKFNELNRSHFESVRRIFGIAYLIPITDQKLQLKHIAQPVLGRYYLRRLAVDQLNEHGCNLDVYLAALIKALVSNRAIARQVNKTSRNITRMFAFSYVSIFGMVALIIYSNRKLQSQYQSSMVILMAALFITNILIVGSARVQANSKRLLSQIWNLIASTYSFRDLRIRHLRSLWIKHALVLTDESGMTLKAFHVSITYETMIQLSLWLSSFIILTY